VAPSTSRSTAPSSQLAREAPVHDHRLAERADEDVVRLQVAVDDPLPVRVRDRLGHRDEVGEEREARGEGGGVAEDGLQRAALDELHGVEGPPLRPVPGLVDGHDGRVLQARGHERLADEAAGGTGARLGVQLLERHRAAQASVAGEQDTAHAAARELALDPVVVRAHLAEGRVA
jgi:hypothetical protein